MIELLGWMAAILLGGALAGFGIAAGAAAAVWLIEWWGSRGTDPLPHGPHGKDKPIEPEPGPDHLPFPSA